MASKGAVNLDTVLISIESDAGKAASNISDLASHLNNLKSSVKGGFSNINKLAESLEKLAPALEKLKSVSSNLQVISEITKSLAQLKDVKSPTGLVNAVTSLERLPEVMNKMDTKTFENLKRVSNELAVALTPLAEKMRQIAEGYSAFSKIQNTFGKSASTAVRYFKQHKSILSSLYPIIKRMGTGFVTLGKGISNAFGKNAYAHMKKFHSQAKQIFLSLLGTRTLFTMLRKAAAEYQAFDEELQKFTRNVWKAFGAQLAPALYLAMDLFKQFVRVIYSVVLALTGIDLIARANARAMAAWAKSSKDTLGSLQKFDDLNVVEFDKDKKGDDKTLIQLDKIDLSPIQKVIDWVRKLKKEIIDAWNSGEWYGVGEVLAEGINMGVASVIKNIDMIRDKFFEIGRDFGDFLNGVIENTKWEDVGKFVTESFTLIPDFITNMLSTINWDSLGVGINNFFKGFDAIEIVNSIGRAIATGLNGIGTILSKQNWSAFGKTLGTVIANVFNGVASFIDNIPWYTIGTKIREVITNIPWRDVWDSIVTLAKESFKGLGEFLAGLFNLNSGELVTIKTTLVGIGVALVTYRITDQVIKLGSAFNNLQKAKKGLIGIGDIFSGLGTKVTGAANALHLLNGNPLLSGDITAMTSLNGLNTGFANLTGSIGKLAATTTGSFGTFAAAVAGVVVVIMALVNSFQELWNESQAFRTSVTELGDMIGGTFNNVLDTMKQMIDQGIATFKSFYQTALKPVFDLLTDIGKPIIEAVIGVLRILWKNIIDPLVGFLSQSFLLTWDMVLIAVEALGLVLKPVISVLEWLWHNVLSPIVSFLLDKFLKAFDNVTSKFKTFVTTIKNTFGSVRTFLDDMLNAMRGGWGSFWSFIKDLLNSMIKGFEKFLNSMINGINGLSKGLRKIGNKIFDIIGVDVKFNPISTVSLPRLETGTNEIPYEGIYHLHPGEAVVPKKYNPALGNGGSEEMNQKLDTLITIMDNMNFTNVVNIGNKRVYEGQQSYNKMQQNKYGTINLY